VGFLPLRDTALLTFVGVVSFDQRGPRHRRKSNRSHWAFNEIRDGLSRCWKLTLRSRKNG